MDIDTYWLVTVQIFSIFSINNKNCIEICYGIVAEGVSDLKGVEGVAEGVEFV
jgi:hypothetical protein